MKLQLLCHFVTFFTLLGLVVAAPAVMATKDVSLNKGDCSKVWWLCFKQAKTPTIKPVPALNGFLASTQPNSGVVVTKDIDSSTTSKTPLIRFNATTSKDIDIANRDCAKVWWLCFKTSDHICNIAPWLCNRNAQPAPGNDSTSFKSSISKAAESGNACNKVWWLCFKEALTSTLALLPVDAKATVGPTAHVVVAKEISSSNRDCAKVWWLCFKKAPNTNFGISSSDVAVPAQLNSDIIVKELQPASHVVVSKNVDSANRDCAKVWWLCFKEAPHSTLIPAPTGIAAPAQPAFDLVASARDITSKKPAAGEVSITPYSPSIDLGACGYQNDDHELVVALATPAWNPA